MNIDCIPEEMRGLKQWVNWKYEDRGTGKPTKIPVTIGGYGAKSTDPCDWYSLSDVVEFECDYSGIGFVFSKDDPYVGIDLDDCFVNGEVQGWAQPIIDRLSNTYSEISPSGNGLKFFLRGKLPFEKGKKVQVENGAIEAYEHSRFFTVTGESFGSSVVADQQEAIDWISETYFRPTNQLKNSTHPKPTVTSGIKNKVERASSYLATMDPAISGSGGHNATFRAACKMVIDFDLTTDEAFRLLKNEFNPRCSEPWTDKELQHKVDSANAQEGQRGMKLIENKAVEGVDLACFDFDSLNKNSMQSNNVELEKPEPVKLHDYHEVHNQTESHPPELLEIPGFINDVTNYTLSVSNRPNKALAFFGAVSLVSALAGRIYKDKFNSRTNLYLIAIAGSGTGKNAPRKTNQDVFAKLQLPGLASSFGSGEGLEDALAVQARILFQTDEIDGLMEALSSDKTNQQTTLVAKLLQIFTDSAGNYVTRPLAGKPPKTIVNPSLSIFGTATPYAFYNSISDRIIKNGLIGRCLVANAAKRGPRQEFKWKEVPSSLIDAAEAILNQGEVPGDLYRTNLSIASSDETQVIKPKMIRGDAESHAEIKRLHDFEDSKLNESTGVFENLWSRFCEQVNKLAMIYALSENPLDPRITKRGIDFSAEFVRHSIEHVINSLSSIGNVSGSVQGRVYDMIRAAGPDGIIHSVLMRKGHFKAKELGEAIFELIEMECIHSDDVATKSRSAKKYTA